VPSKRENGIVIGLVTSLDDPQRLGRVKVKFPHLDSQESDWARLVTPMAGADRGLFLRPEVGDEVMVAFEHGDPRRPHVLGSLWSSTDKTPSDDGNATRNNWRFIKSRSGHIIKLDDTSGAEKIEVVDKDGNRKVVIDSANQKIQVICEVGDIEITASAGAVKVNAVSVQVNAQGNMSLVATGTMTIKGAAVNIN
jgi:uncharacterized protein involved in type VI secretion and phage assembly